MAKKSSEKSARVTLSELTETLESDDVDIERKNEEKRQKRIGELSKTSQPLQELVIEAEFYVDSVNAQTYHTSITPHSERVAGGQTPVYSAGQYSVSLLEVIPINEDLPVQKLRFNGKTNAMPGDSITAMMPVYKQETVRGNTFKHNSQDEHFYFERPFDEEESAIEIRIHYERGDYTEKGTDYHDYIPESKDTE